MRDIGTETPTVVGDNGGNDTFPLALDARALAKALGVSLRHVRRLQSAQRLPRAVKLGRSVRWDLATIRAWLAAGAPDRKSWEAMQAQQQRRAG